MGFIASTVAVWFFGIKRHIQKSSFEKEVDKIYKFDFNNDIVKEKSNIYKIEGYYDFDRHILVECPYIFITLEKEKLTHDFSKELEKRMDIWK